MTLPLLTLDTRAFGDADGCRLAAAALGRVGAVLSEARSQVDDATVTTLAWQGTMTGALGVSVGEDRVVLAAALEATARLATALDRFGDELDGVAQQLLSARRDAAAHGLALTADAIELQFSGIVSVGSAVIADAGLDWASGRARDAVTAARARESAAHQALSAAWANDAPFWMDALRDVGLFPPASDEVFDRGLWGAGLGMTTLSVVAERKAKDARWKAFGSVLGPTGTALTFFSTTREQLAADADDRSLSTADRWGRAVVMGTARTGGSVVGNLAGGAVAKGFGALLGLPAAPESGGASVPVGMSVVGTGGAILGGWGGDKVGKAIGARAMEGVDEVNDAIESAAVVAKDLGEAAVDEVEERADDLRDKGVATAKEAGDRIVFWR